MNTVLQNLNMGRKRREEFLKLILGKYYHRDLMATVKKEHDSESTVVQARSGKGLSGGADHIRGGEGCCAGDKGNGLADQQS